MVADSMWQAFDGTLRALERSAEEAGWDQPPGLLGIFDGPGPDESTRRLLWHEVVDPGVWSTGPDNAEILGALAEDWTAPGTAEDFRAAAHEDGRVPVAFVYIGEEWGRPVAHPDVYRRGNVIAFPDRVEQRLTVAVDFQGGRHLLVRTRGDDSPQELDGNKLAGGIADALRRLIMVAAGR